MLLRKVSALLDPDSANVWLRLGRPQEGLDFRLVEILPRPGPQVGRWITVRLDDGTEGAPRFVVSLHLDDVVEVGFLSGQPTK